MGRRPHSERKGQHHKTLVVAKSSERDLRMAMIDWLLRKIFGASLRNDVYDLF